MKRFLTFAALALAAILVPRSHAQTVELDCPSGMTRASGFVVPDLTTSGVKFPVCVSKQGDILWQSSIATPVLAQPTGSCFGTQSAFNVNSQVLYICSSGAWLAVTGSGSSGSIQGTTNQIIAVTLSGLTTLSLASPTIFPGGGQFNGALSVNSGIGALGLVPDLLCPFSVQNGQDQICNLNGQLVVNFQGIGGQNYLIPWMKYYDLINSPPINGTLIFFNSVAGELELFNGNNSGNKFLQENASGQLSWVASVAASLSSITPATASNTIQNGANPQTWQWNFGAATSQTGLTLQDTGSTGSGDALLALLTSNGSIAAPFTINQGSAPSGTNASLSMLVIGGAGGAAASATSAGNQGASVSITLGNGSAGGATSGAGGSGGISTITSGSGGSSVSGAGGLGGNNNLVAGSGGGTTGGTGGNGGTVSLTAGAGGTSSGTNANSNGGDIQLLPGLAGTGGSGAAGIPGKVIIGVNGTQAQPSLVWTGQTLDGIYYIPSTNRVIAFGFNGTGTKFGIDLTGGQIRGNSGAAFSWSSASNVTGTNNADTCLDRSAAGTVRVDSNSACSNGLGSMTMATITSTTQQITEGSAPSGVNGSDVIYADSTTHTFSVSANSQPFTPISRVLCVSVSPVTVNTSTTSDQNLQSCSTGTGAVEIMNTVGRTLRVTMNGVYSNVVTSQPTVTLKVKFCSVSGCGSGTVISPISITSSATSATAVTNEPADLTGTITTAVTGASSTYEAHGIMTIDLSTTASAADTVFADTNTATVGTIDSGNQIFIQFAVAFSVASTSNSYTSRQVMVEVIN